MTVEVLRSLSEVRDVTEPWVALADAADARHNMQPYWCLPWWSQEGSGELHVVVVKSGGELIALAPLYRTRRLGIDTLRFLGSHMLGVGEVVVAPGQEAAGEELWAFLLKRPRCVVDLRHHRLPSRGFDALRRIDRRLWSAELGPASPHVLIADSWDDFWNQRRTKFRRELERTVRVAEREGIPVRVELATDTDDIERLLPDMSAVFDAAERTRTRLAMLSGVYRPFTLEVFRGAAERRRLALFVLYLGDSPAATQFTLRGKTIMGGGGLRFDPAYARFSPGQLLFRYVLEYAFSSGCTEFDFGPKDAPYKRQWSTGAYDTVEITAFSSESIHTMHRAKSAVDAARYRKRDVRQSLELAKQNASATSIDGRAID